MNHLCFSMFTRFKDIGVRATFRPFCDSSTSFPISIDPTDPDSDKRIKDITNLCPKCLHIYRQHYIIITLQKELQDK